MESPPGSRQAADQTGRGVVCRFTRSIRAQIQPGDVGKVPRVFGDEGEAVVKRGRGDDAVGRADGRATQAERTDAANFHAAFFSGAVGWVRSTPAFTRMTPAA